MSDTELKKSATQGLPPGLLFVGVKPIQEFASTPQASARSARLALFTFRAKNLSDEMDQAERLKVRLLDAYSHIDTAKEHSIRDVISTGTELVAVFKKLNEKAFHIGAISKDAFNLLDHVNEDVLVRIGFFMPDTIQKTQEVLSSSLDSAKKLGGPRVIQLKQLCFEMDSLSEFWKTKVLQKVEATLESIQRHNAELAYDSPMSQRSST